MRVRQLLLVVPRPDQEHVAHDDPTGRGPPAGLQHHRAVAAKQVQIVVVVVLRGHRVEDKAEPCGVPLERTSLAGRNEIVGSKPERVIAFSRRMTQHGYVRAHRLRKLHPHVA